MRLRVLPLAAAAAIVLAGCGSATPGTVVASLTDSGPTTTAKAGNGAAQGKQDLQDAMLAYTRCMREHGVDMPDPTFSPGAGGGFAISSRGPSSRNPTSPSFEAAETACKPILDKAAQDAPRPTPEQEAKMRDGALAFARCIREHGVDMPDPTFDADGGARIVISGGQSDDTSGAVVSGGNGTTRLNPADPTFQAAQQACAGEGAGGPGMVTAGSAA